MFQAALDATTPGSSQSSLTTKGAAFFSALVDDAVSRHGYTLPEIEADAESPKEMYSVPIMTSVDTLK